MNMPKQGHSAGFSVSFSLACANKISPIRGGTCPIKSLVPGDKCQIRDPQSLMGGKPSLWNFPSSVLILASYRAPQAGNVDYFLSSQGTCQRRERSEISGDKRWRVWKNCVSWSPGLGKSPENFQWGKERDKSLLTPKREVSRMFRWEASPALATCEERATWRTMKLARLAAYPSPMPVSNAS